MIGKKRRKKFRKTVFYIHTNIATKNGGEKRRETIFPETLQIVRLNNVWKKIVSKNCEISFLFKHEYRDQKMMEKNARYNFSRNTQIVHAKNVGKKSSQKVRNSASKKC